MAATATATAAGPRYAPPDPTLPKPWKGLVDGRTGYIYFWNPVTNVTQYERPTGSDSMAKSSGMSVSSSVHIQQYSEGHREQSPGRENHRYYRSSNGGLKMEAESMSNQTVRSELDYSLNGPSGVASAGIGSSSSRGHGSISEVNGLSAEAYRRRHEIKLMGDNVPPPLMSFESTGFPSEILREVHNAGFSVPTPIQAQSWPIALHHRDIVAIAKTGSGKTLGYLIPGFIHIKHCRNNPQMGPTVLVLAPTRELATQIQDEVVKFGKSSRISCTCLYGGAQKGPQLRQLERGADIVVATPGRLNDILEMRRVSLHQVSYLVLDEADRMLDMGFEPQIRKIVKEVPARRQTLMFTATWPREVRKIAADLLVNPVQVNIGNVDELVANKSITQYIEVLAPMEKNRRLEQILRSQEPGSKIIIFCSTKKMCDQLARNLTRQFGAAAIHGDKSQNERDYVLNQFRSGRSPVLVATDVAARGLDIKDIRVVINYDFPAGVEDYVHRIGRTGRAGATGVAYTFFGDQDTKYASDLIKVLEGAKQRVPPEVRDMASRGGGMGRPRRWASGSSGYEGGRGGRNDSGFSGRDSGRGGRGTSTFSSSRQERSGGRGYGHDSRDRNDCGYSDGFDRGRSSRSPAGWGDCSKNSSRDRSPSPRPDRYDRTAACERPPVKSFHETTMRHYQSSPPSQAHNGSREYKNVDSHNRNKRSRSPYGGAASDRGENFGGANKGLESEWGRSAIQNGGNADVPATLAGDEEEGMIPPDDNDTYH